MFGSFLLLERDRKREREREKERKRERERKKEREGLSSCMDLISLVI